MINKNFYPTPNAVIEKMFENYKVGYRSLEILEPSAGKGDIVDYVTEHYKYGNVKIDCIEIDDELIATLKGKKYNVVHNNFLTFNTFKHYDLIVMNPPFDEGDKHLLKAIRLQQVYGGDIICLLNAETLKNPYSNTRKELCMLLEKLDASVEYTENCFNTMEAERRTDVEIALVKIHIEPKVQESTFFEKLKNEEQPQVIDYECKEITKFASENDFVESAVEQYNFEVQLGIKLINEYNAMRPYIKNSLDENDKYATPILSLDIGKTSATVNNYVESVRMKYWKALFTNDKFVGKLTTNLKQELYSSVEKLKDFDFSVYNIMTIQQDLMKKTIQGVEDTIVKMFDEFSQQYSWYDTSKNVHYYNGWKTNKAWKVNEKVILPISAYDSIWGRIELQWRIKEKFTDIVQVFNYLQTKNRQNIDVDKIIKDAEQQENYTDIDFGYFTATFYKKGTTHIKFKDLDLLEKFNLFGSQKKGWLPPDFGKTKYNDLNNESKKVVDEYCGEQKYNSIVQNSDYFLVESQQLLQICG